MADPQGELGAMVSRAVPEISSDPKTMARDVRKVLRQHFQDIQTLFAMTTDSDRIEKLRRDNEEL